MGEDTIRVQRCADENGNLIPGSVQVTSNYVSKGVIGHFAEQATGREQIVK
ncbi:hypothetical protein [Streptomyces sp. NPDC005322]|uniref:hypothetical protein n=1 Tax=unclassified Streptomyces TaxID=2593676 RepID=UPI0033B06C75